MELSSDGFRPPGARVDCRHHDSILKINCLRRYQRNKRCINRLVSASFFSPLRRSCNAIFVASPPPGDSAEFIFFNGFFHSSTNSLWSKRILIKGNFWLIDRFRSRSSDQLKVQRIPNRFSEFLRGNIYSKTQTQLSHRRSARNWMMNSLRHQIRSPRRHINDNPFFSIVRLRESACPAAASSPCFGQVN